MPTTLVSYEAMFWRTGRKIGRTVYAMVDLDPTEFDPLIGVMDTKALAEAAVRAHNAELTASRGL